MASVGTLHLTIVRAELTRDTELFGKMSPYVALAHRENKVKTDIKMKAGKNPVFQETWELDVKYLGDELQIGVWDHEPIGKDDHIGSVTIKMAAICVDGLTDNWFDLMHKNKKAGRICFSSKWEPAQQAQQPAMGMPAMQMDPAQMMMMMQMMQQMNQK